MKNKLQQLKKASQICLISHNEPDSDALCGMFVLKNFLQTQYGKEVDCFAEFTHLPENYYCWQGTQELNPTPKDYDFAIMMDSPKTERLGCFESLFLHAKNKIIIDHHATNEFDKTSNVIKIVSSTCEIVFDLLSKEHYRFSKQDYEMIYAGIITDTNNLTCGEINKHTFEVVGECVQNVEIYPIYENLMLNNTRKNMDIFALAIQNAKYYCDEKIIISHISKQQAEQLNVTQDNYTGIINRLATISGVKLVAFIYPKQDVYYVSMRGRRGCNVGKIAKHHNGGGHDGAAAYLSAENLDSIQNDLLEEFESELSQHSLTC